MWKSYIFGMRAPFLHYEKKSDAYYLNDNRCKVYSGVKEFMIDVRR